MTTQRRLPAHLAASAIASMLAGCATQTITSALPKASPVDGEPSRIDAVPSTVYGRIAAGANACWFAATGQLKKSHIFHADVEPPSKGGAVEVAVHERDLAGQKPWGPKAFKVVLQASGEQSTIGVENLKMPEAAAVLMRADVFGWAQGGKDCRLKPLDPPPAPAAKPVPKRKVKPKAP
jgi:hypothetical protein